MRARGRRVPDGLFRAAALALFALQCGSAAAADLRVGAGIDVLHRQNMPAASLKYGAASALVWDNKNYGAGLTYDMGKAQGWQAGLGSLLVGRSDEDVGTYLNALLRLSYCGTRVCVTGVHISHAGSLGIGNDKPNSGLNFLLLELR